MARRANEEGSAVAEADRSILSQRLREAHEKFLEEKMEREAVVMRLKESEAKFVAMKEEFETFSIDSKTAKLVMAKQIKVSRQHCALFLSVIL